MSIAFQSTHVVTLAKQTQFLRMLPFLKIFLELTSDPVKVYEETRLIRLIPWF